MASKKFGFDKLQKELVNIAEKQAPDKIDRKVEALQMMLLADVKQGTPVKSGNLKRRWTTTKVMNGKGEVNNPAEYAPHIENGFKHKNGGYKIPGKHMLESSLELLHNRMPSEMNKFFVDLLKDLKL